MSNTHIPKKSPAAMEALWRWTVAFTEEADIAFDEDREVFFDGNGVNPCEARRVFAGLWRMVPERCPTCGGAKEKPEAVCSRCYVNRNHEHGMSTTFHFCSDAFHKEASRE